jgi:RimJ/RimL family protein N-acetyltransferase
LVASTLAVHGAKDSADEFYDFHSQLSEKKALRLFYSPEHFMSPMAKVQFLEPDLTPLPVIASPARGPERRVLEAADGLRLRPIEPTDAQALFEAARESIAEVSPWMGWCDAEYELRHAAAWASRQPVLWARGEEFAFALEEAGQPGVAGTCGLNSIQRENRFGNLGYWVRTSRLRRGLASRAARRVAAFAIEEVGLERVEIVAASANVASQLTAMKAGAQREAVLRRRVRVREQVFDAVMFSITSADNPSSPIENCQACSGH